ncbi:MAG: FAD-binding oxidoreductase [Verrucomicrobia bacterium]|jgi:FAD/FMN-containing dehydrogenase|nr:FAD-binding oxidoreductase [Verrucomicrobiota bacterium]
MNLQPQDSNELSKALAQADAEKTIVRSIDFEHLNRIQNHSPEDMTVTVQAGMFLSDLQSHLAHSGQWLPLDPPLVEKWTIHDLMNQNPSGPRRCSAGTLRDYVIGLEAVRANGEKIKSGGQVVKNVAGFDLCKLFIGAQGSLGVIHSVTFKLLPLPDKELVWKCEIQNLNQLETILKRIGALHRNALPSVLDFYSDGIGKQVGHLIVGFNGNAHAVDQSSDSLLGAKLGFEYYCTWVRASAASSLPELEYQRQFWGNRSWNQMTKESVLRSRLPALIEQLPPTTPCVARLGQGSLYHTSERMTVPKPRPRSLELRMKQQFDPNGILPDLP